MGLGVLGGPIWLLSPDKDAKDTWDTGPVLKATLQFREAVCSQNWVLSPQGPKPPHFSHCLAVHTIISQFLYILQTQLYFGYGVLLRFILDKV